MRKYCTHEKDEDFSEMEHSKSIMDLISSSKKADIAETLSLSCQLIGKGAMFPKVLFERCTVLFGKKGDSLGDEKWNLLERILIAAIKLDEEIWIGYCLKSLREKFPGSSRVERLVALYKESTQDYTEAESIYKKVLMKTPENIYVRKRLISCLKAQGRTKDAMNAIIDQLEIFSTDTELWHELCMMYMRQVAFSRAIFSFEEVLLADSKSFYNLLVYAELLASSGQSVMARKYYCKALEYRPIELRALWGVLTCIVPQQLGNKRSDEKENRIVTQLRSEVKKRLIGIYAKQSTTTAKVAIRMVERISA